METTVITAGAAALGSLVGFAASVVTTWITQRTQRDHARRGEMFREREALYGEFITEAARLTVEALSHSLERPETFVKLYGILGRIRLVAADSVLAEAEACGRRIVELYAQPNMTIEEIRAAFKQDRIDLIKDFSAACRRELLDITAGRERLP
jgi:hypothetical protein